MVTTSNPYEAGEGGCQKEKDKDSARLSEFDSHQSGRSSTEGFVERVYVGNFGDFATKDMGS